MTKVSEIATMRTTNNYFREVEGEGEETTTAMHSQSRGMGEYLSESGRSIPTKYSLRNAAKTNSRTEVFMCMKYSDLDRARANHIDNIM